MQAVALSARRSSVAVSNPSASLEAHDGGAAAPPLAPRRRGTGFEDKLEKWQDALANAETTSLDMIMELVPSGGSVAPLETVRAQLRSFSEAAATIVRDLASAHTADVEQRFKSGRAQMQLKLATVRTSAKIMQENAENSLKAQHRRELEEQQLQMGDPEALREALATVEELTAQTEELPHLKLKIEGLQSALDKASQLTKAAEQRVSSLEAAQARAEAEHVKHSELLDKARAELGLIDDGPAEGAAPPAGAAAGDQPPSSRRASQELASAFSTFEPRLKQVVKCGCRLQKQLASAQAELQDTRAQLEAAAAEAATLREEVGTLRAEREEDRQRLAQLTAQLEEAATVRAERDAAIAERDALAAEVERLGSQVQSLEGRLRDSQEQVESSRAELTTLAAAVEREERERERLVGELAEAHAELARLASAQTRIEALEAELAQLKGEHAELRAEHSAVLGRMKGMEAEHAKAVGMRASLESKLSAASEKLLAAQRDLKDTKDRLDRFLDPNDPDPKVSYWMCSHHPLPLPTIPWPHPFLPSLADPKVSYWMKEAKKEKERADGLEYRLQQAEKKLEKASEEAATLKDKLQNIDATIKERVDAVQEEARQRQRVLVKAALASLQTLSAHCGVVRAAASGAAAAALGAAAPEANSFAATGGTAAGGDAEGVDFVLSPHKHRWGMVADGIDGIVVRVQPPLALAPSPRRPRPERLRQHAPVRARKAVPLPRAPPPDAEEHTEEQQAGSGQHAEAADTAGFLPPLSPRLSPSTGGASPRSGRSSPSRKSPSVYPPSPVQEKRPSLHGSALSRASKEQAALTAREQAAARHNHHA